MRATQPREQQNKNQSSINIQHRADNRYSVVSFVLVILFHWLSTSHAVPRPNKGSHMSTCMHSVFFVFFSRFFSSTVWVGSSKAPLGIAFIQSFYKVFHMVDVFSVIQQTASKHWRRCAPIWWGEHFSCLLYMTPPITPIDLSKSQMLHGCCFWVTRWPSG